MKKQKFKAYKQACQDIQDHFRSLGKAYMRGSITEFRWFEIREKINAWLNQTENLIERDESDAGRTHERSH